MDNVELVEEGLFLQVEDVTSHMARLVTFSVGRLGVFLGVGTVQVKRMFMCIMEGVITFSMGRLVPFHMAGLVSACVFSLPPSWVGTVRVNGARGACRTWWVEMCR